MSPSLNNFSFVLKGLNMNNPVRSAGKNTISSGSPEGAEYDRIDIYELKAGIYVVKLTAANKTSSVEFTMQ